MELDLSGVPASTFLFTQDINQILRQMSEAAVA